MTDAYYRNTDVFIIWYVFDLILIYLTKKAAILVVDTNKPGNIAFENSEKWINNLKKRNEGFIQNQAST